jgi:hypothetical protein
MACRYATDYERVAAIVAIFSAMSEWRKNIVAADRFLAAYVIDGKRGRELPAVVMNSTMLRKAERIMTADPSEFENIIAKDGPDNSRSWKTLCFYRNLIGETDRVTIDVWMWRAMSDDASSLYRPEGWHYMMCESVIMSLAEEYNITGPEMQAILWVMVRGDAH